MDSWRLPRNVPLLHGRAACGAQPTATIRSGGDCYRRTALRPHFRHRPAVNDPSTAINGVDPDTDPMGRACAIGESSERSAACCTCDLALARLRSSASHGFRADPPLFNKRRSRELTSVACSGRSCTIDDERMREGLVICGRRVVAGCETRVDGSDFKGLERRLVELVARVPAAAPDTADAS